MTRMIHKVLLTVAVTLLVTAPSLAQDVENLKLRDYRPQSVFRVPVTDVTRARYPVIDVHAHDYARTPGELDAWVKKMDTLGIEKIIILSGRTGSQFEEIIKRYSRYPARFDVWCGFDYTGFDEPGWAERAVAELEKCYRLGATGVGEISDKGMGITRSKDDPSHNMHLDDPRMKPLFEKCAELGMPVNVHVADPYWAYLPMDSTNDGLMSAYRWRIDLTREGIYDHAKLIQTLENAVRDNPRTTFIACHLANCDFDLSILGRLLDRYPNLYADISARYYQTATIPRQVRSFYSKYRDRLMYGTDMSTATEMYRFTFRVLETADEHFYFRYTYHWPLYGLDLDDDVLKKIYRDNALRLLDRKGK
ncbi:MAG: amidohydrolase family protein [Bacteroidota bacterium]|nr:MAG: amidohydrolase [Bacteroidota bacterium]